MHHLHINPSEIEQWEFYEYQYTINNLIEHLKKEKDNNSEQEEESTKQYSNLSSTINSTKSSGLKGTNNYIKGINKTTGLKSVGLSKPSIKVPKL